MTHHDPSDCGQIAPPMSFQFKGKQFAILGTPSIWHEAPSMEMGAMRYRAPIMRFEFAINAEVVRNLWPNVLPDHATKLKTMSLERYRIKIDAVNKVKNASDAEKLSIAIEMENALYANDYYTCIAFCYLLIDYFTVTMDVRGKPINLRVERGKAPALPGIGPFRNEIVVKLEGRAA